MGELENRKIREFVSVGTTWGPELEMHFYNY